MTSQERDRIIMADRCRFYDCPEERFAEPGTTFRHAESLDGSDRFFHTKLHNRDFVSAGKETLTRLKPNAESLGDRLLTGELAEERYAYPHLFYVKDALPQIGPLPPGYRLASHDPADLPQLKDFLSLCSEADIEDADIRLDDPDEEIRLVIWNDRVIGYAGYRVWDSGLCDMGILIQPEHRRRGLGVAAVAAATTACLNRGRLPMYRTSTDNTGSLSIALKVGFEQKWLTREFELKS